jgi:L-lactate dehydrogenase complex protein LldG
MNARDGIYANIRRALGISGREASRRAAVEERLLQAPRGIVPERGSLDAAGRLALFKAEAETAAASVARISKAAAVPNEVARYLRAHDLALTLRIASDIRLAGMPFVASALEIAEGRAEASDTNTLSHAFAGVAETGTLVLTSGPDNPTTLNFLPDNHIVILRVKDIVGDYEAVWQRLRLAYGKGHMPRTVNFITGPSRSADIEQEIILGAHGPRRLHIVIVD